LKTTAAHFEYFKSEVLRWVEKLGVTDYRVGFLHTNIDAYARVRTLSVKKVATVDFCTDWYTEERPLNKASITDTAKHEAIHILLSDLASIGNSRFVTTDEALTAEEATVRRIQRLL